MSDIACQHGSLARACELCFRDGEIEELRVLLGEAREQLDWDGGLSLIEQVRLRSRIDAKLASRVVPPSS